jgi:hypothetical protein
MLPRTRSSVARIAHVEEAPVSGDDRVGILGAAKRHEVVVVRIDRQSMCRRSLIDGDASSSERPRVSAR